MTGQKSGLSATGKLKAKKPMARELSILLQSSANHFTTTERLIPNMPHRNRALLSLPIKMLSAEKVSERL